MDVNQVSGVLHKYTKSYDSNEEDFSCLIKVLLMRGFYHDNADSLHE